MLFTATLTADDCCWSWKLSVFTCDLKNVLKLILLALFSFAISIVIQPRRVESLNVELNVGSNFGIILEVLC